MAKYKEMFDLRDRKEYQLDLGIVSREEESGLHAMQRLQKKRITQVSKVSKPRLWQEEL